MANETTGKTTTAPPAPAGPKAPAGGMVTLRVNPAIFPTDVVRLQAPGVEAADARKPGSVVEFTKAGVAVPAGDVAHYTAFKEGSHQMVVKVPDADS